MSNVTSVSIQFGPGSVLWFLIGAVCSFLVNHSIFWALIHGIFGPIYILYLCLGCGGGFEGVEAGIDRATSANTITEVYRA